MRSYFVSFFTDQDVPPVTNLFAYDLVLLFITSIVSRIHFLKKVIHMFISWFFILPAFKNKIMLKDILLWFLSIDFIQIVSLQSFSVKVVLWLRVVIKFVTVHDKILTGSAAFVVTTKNKIFISGQSFLNLSPFSEQFSFFSQLCGQFNL